MAVLAPRSSCGLREAGPILRGSEGCTGLRTRATKQNEAFSYYDQAGKSWSPQLNEGSAGLTPSLPFARHAQFNRALEKSKSQEINVFSLSFLLPVK